MTESIFMEDITCPLRTVEDLQSLGFELPSAHFWWVQRENGQKDIYTEITVDSMRNVPRATVNILGPAYLAEELEKILLAFSLPDHDPEFYILDAEHDKKYYLTNEKGEKPENEAEARAMMIAFLIRTEQIKVAPEHKFIPQPKA